MIHFNLMDFFSLHRVEAEQLRVKDVTHECGIDLLSGSLGYVGGEREIERETFPVSIKMLTTRGK